MLCRGEGGGVSKEDDISENEVMMCVKRITTIISLKSGVT